MLEYLEYKVTTSGTKAKHEDVDRLLNTINKSIWNKIKFHRDIKPELVTDIDENDTLFIDLTNHIKGKLWTGDKKLFSGLQKKRYLKTITTDELYEQFLGKQTDFRRRKKQKL